MLIVGMNNNKEKRKSGEIIIENNSIKIIMLLNIKGSNKIKDTGLIKWIILSRYKDQA
jgi:hypothetical protein